MNQLGQFYTTDTFSKLLISQFTNTKPVNVIDLGVGGGSLIRAAISRWAKASYYAVDVDKRSIKKIQNELPFVKSFHINTLKDELTEKLNIKKGHVDVAICNPPFLKLKNSLCYDDLFEEAGLPECKNLKLLTSDIIFLAKNLQLLKQDGELGIILPDSLITGKEFLPLRNSLLHHHNLKGLIELPENIYAKTEALTHILVIEKNASSKNTSPLFLADKNGEIIEEIEVKKNSLLERMDFKYHAWKNKQKKLVKCTTLEDLGVDIKRGSQTHIKLKKSNDNFIHTTEIIHKKNNQAIKSHIIKNEKYLLTKKGDILVSRVGRNYKICMISKGRAPFSDCIYRIRVPEKNRLRVWNGLISNKGQSWFKANAHGVCAKVISKKDLLNFPVD